MSIWSEFIATMTPERADRIRDNMIRMRTREGMEEVVNCMMAAVHMLGGEGGRELADRLAEKQAADSYGPGA